MICAVHLKHLSNFLTSGTYLMTGCWRKARRLVLFSFECRRNPKKVFGQSIKEVSSRIHVHNEKRIKISLCSLNAVKYRQSQSQSLGLGLGLGLEAYQVLSLSPCPFHRGQIPAKRQPAQRR